MRIRRVERERETRRLAAPLAELDPFLPRSPPWQRKERGREGRARWTQRQSGARCSKSRRIRRPAVQSLIASTLSSGSTCSAPRPTCSRQRQRRTIRPCSSRSLRAARPPRVAHRHPLCNPCRPIAPCRNRAGRRPSLDSDPRRPVTEGRPKRRSQRRDRHRLRD
jgi:hypothetical protein